ncbi:MAG: hypothetical protein DSM106950_14270 [Stigonema ocellatum SAG 48.90 = DSM 106950]|nr:hypothetical protein [Stigonema ocellatum SAG 48.90 = DSM 106950]
MHSRKRSPLQIYQIGDKQHKLHFKQYFHNYFCLIFDLTLNEYVQLHLVMELTFKWTGARYEPLTGAAIAPVKYERNTFYSNL